jgi:hypothetical protein
MAEGPLAVEAYAFLEEEGKNVEGAYAQWKRELEESTERARKENANKPKKVDPIAEALARREERRRQKSEAAASVAGDLLGYVLTGMFNSVADYLINGAKSDGGNQVYAGSRAVLICNDYDGLEYDTGLSIECSSSDTFYDCISRLEEQMRRSGYDYPSSYCDIKNPDYHKGFFEPYEFSRHGYITVK